MKVISTVSVERSGENGYEFYRIPGICVTDRGTVLVSYEARHGSDWSVIDLYVKRSLDGGKTWEDRIPVFSGEGKNTTNNPVLIADGALVHLLCLKNYKMLYHLTSADEGRTWSEPENITEALESGRPVWDWTCAAVGPGHGVRLNGGRLLASVWLARDRSNITRHWPSKVSTLYSDDHGKTWALGEIFEPEGSVNPNESCLAELSDHRVLMNIRSMKPAGADRSTPHYRYMAVSDTGCGPWRCYRETQLPDPVCAGGMCRYPGGLLFTNCADYADRIRHTLSLSRDDGKTWQNGITYNLPAGYSDCACHPASGRILTFYEYDRESELRVSIIAPDESESD